MTSAREGIWISASLLLEFAITGEKGLSDHPAAPCFEDVFSSILTFSRWTTFDSSDRGAMDPALTELSNAKDDNIGDSPIKEVEEDRRSKPCDGSGRGASCCGFEGRRRWLINEDDDDRFKC